MAFNAKAVSCPKTSAAIVLKVHVNSLLGLVSYRMSCANVHRCMLLITKKRNRVNLMCALHYCVRACKTALTCQLCLAAGHGAAEPS